MFATGSIAIVIAVWRIILVAISVGSCTGISVEFLAEKHREIVGERFCLDRSMATLYNLLEVGQCKYHILGGSTT